MQDCAVLLYGTAEQRWSWLRADITEVHGAQVIGDTEREEHAIETAKAHQPDLILFSDRGDPATDVSALDGLRRACPASRIIVFTHQMDWWRRLPVSQLGMASFVLWRDVQRKSLRPLLRLLVDCDGLAVSSTRVRRAFLRTVRERSDTDIPPVGMTDREREILRLLALGHTRDEIAKHTNLSVRTVHRTIARLQDKLGATSPVALGAKIARLGIIS